MWTNSSGQSVSDKKMSKIAKVLRQEITNSRATISRCRVIMANANLTFEKSIEEAEQEVAEKEKMLLKLEK
jgi:lipopolysaccharide biosynthesis regulator YciM